MTALARFSCVLLILLVLLGLTFFLAHIDLGSLQTPISLLIGAMKAVLIALFFMDLRSADGLHRVFALTGFFFLAILIVLSMSDFVSRGWLALPGQFPPIQNNE